MKTFFQLLAIAIILSLIIFTVFQKSESIQLVQEAVLKTESSLERKQRSKDRLDELVKESRQTASSLVPAEPPAAPEACANDWTQVQEFEWQAGDAGRLPAFEACAGEPEVVASRRLAYSEQCFMNESASDDTQCMEAFFNYRASINGHLFTNRSVAEVNDVPLLIDLLFHSFMDGSTNPQQARDVSERLHRLEPDLYEPVKALVVADFMQASEIENESSREEAIQSLLQNIERAEEYGMDDPELVEARILAESRFLKDPDRVDAYLANLQEDEFYEPISLYYQAAVSKERGQLDEALQKLDQAIALDPKNQRFRDTRSKLLQMKENPARKIEAFSLKLKLNLEVEDEGIESASGGKTQEPENQTESPEAPISSD